MGLVVMERELAWRRGIGMVESLGRTRRSGVRGRVGGSGWSLTVERERRVVASDPWTR